MYLKKKKNPSKAQHFCFTLFLLLLSLTVELNKMVRKDTVILKLKIFI